MSNLSNNLSKAFKNFGKILDKKSPEILLGCGIAGFFSSIILVAKETPRAVKALDDLYLELDAKEEELTKPKLIFEEVKAVAPIYAPAAVTATLSTLCVLGSYKIGSRRTAAIATAYEITQKNFKDYQARTKEVVGDKKEEQIRQQVMQKRLDEDENKELSKEIVVTDGYVLCYDSYYGRYFRSNVEELTKIVSELNLRLRDNIDNFVPLNDFYYEVGLRPVAGGDDIGWYADDGDIDLKYDTILAPDKTPCLSVIYEISPRWGKTYR